MDPRLATIAEDPANTIFAVVFFPDRIYHQEYLNATRSPRYRYNVQEVRGYHEVLCLKGRVFLDGALYCNFLRFEYRGTRLTEAVRTKNRLLRDNCSRLDPPDRQGRQAGARRRATDCSRCTGTTGSTPTRPRSGRRLNRPPPAGTTRQCWP